MYSILVTYMVIGKYIIRVSLKQNQFVLLVNNTTSCGSFLHNNIYQWEWDKAIFDIGEALINTIELLDYLS